jgi:hypothetical protein
MNAQLGVDAVHMVLAGRPISGLSSAPARTTTNAGRPRSSLNRGVPRVGQNRRRMTCKLSALLRYSLTGPLIWKLLVAKITLMDALPDDSYWQSLHQQARVATGG